MRRSLSPLRPSAPDEVREPHGLSTVSSDSTNFANWSLSLSAPSFRGCVVSQESGTLAESNTTLSKDRQMRRSPLRAISSPSAEQSVDVAGRSRLRSAFLPHITQEPEVSRTSLGHFVGSTDAQDWSSPSQLAGDANRPGPAPQPQFSEEEI
jgi:hypothetical protein